MLSTTVPRVLRAATSGLVPSSRRGNRTLFDQDAVDTLRALWGVTPRHSDLTSEQLKILAALSRRPNGLRSARAVARAAGVSPTTASRELDRLTRRELVRQNTTRIASGRVTDVTVWEIKWGSVEWLAKASEVSAVVLPDTPRRPRVSRVPAGLGHLFWNEDLRQLDTEQDATLIAERILLSTDPEGLAWMVDALPAANIAAAAHMRGVDVRTARLAALLAGAER